MTAAAETALAPRAEGYPPPPHDPRERERIATAGPWEVLQFAADDSRIRYFAPRRMLHLQLWHPGRRISILTPSLITDGLYEVVLASHGDRGRTPSLPALREALREVLRVELPTDRQLERWTTWYVDRYARLGA